MKIPINQIKPNPQQPRKTFNRASIEELAQSIIQVGLIQPVVVTPNGKGYYLVDGERRWRAAQLIPGMLEIEAVVSDQIGTDLDSLVQSLVANIQREDLTVLEEAQAYQKLHKECGMSMARIALLVGKALPTIKNRMQILELDPEIQNMMADGSLMHDQRVISSIQSLPADMRIRTAKRISRSGLSINGIEKTTKIIKDQLRNDPTDVKEQDFDIPALKFAAKREKYHHQRKWGALQQLGKLPAWELVVSSAEATCDVCSLGTSASEIICRECPAVEMIAKLMRAAS